MQDRQIWEAEICFTLPWQEKVAMESTYRHAKSKSKLSYSHNELMSY